jgi:hypothetical protein
MPKPEEEPRYTDPDHPYSGSGNRYQNLYSKEGEYHRGDGPFQFPWWAIVIGFVVWWPLGFIFIALNSAMRKGRLGGFEQAARQKTRATMDWNVTPVYARNSADQAAFQASATQQKKSRKKKAKSANAQGSGLVTGLTITGIALLAVGLLALPDGMYWLPDALAEGGYYWPWLLEEMIPVLMMLTGGVGCLFGAHTVRTNRRMRKKIDNIVGDSKYMAIEDIAASIPCSYEKCCKHLENCIDDGVFGPEAYLDMRGRYLVVEGKAPAPEPQKPPEKPAEMTRPEKDQYQAILDALRSVNDAIPDEEMSDKISRLEAVSAKIFDQAKSDPDKLPRMRKFMDYYLPTSLKLLQTYAELDAQGVEGENISESKRRIEQTMDTLVHAFETQLDQLFQEDAMDVSADIDVMENMLRADGLAGDTPFKL